jgi:hypothetical protein
MLCWHCCVVAELDTSEAVEIVANLVSAIAAHALISALRIVPSESLCYLLCQYQYLRLCQQGLFRVRL